jgi:tRNA threonylcarbamoyladenosine biosynthesis protein TsaB
MNVQDTPREPLRDSLLAFDTSTERMALGLATPDGRWVDDRPGGAAASATLLPAIEALLQAAGRHLGDVSAIAFGQGPGAFTGLRSSCAVAQGLAFGLDCPVLAIDSLRLVAEQARRQAAAGAGFEVAVLMDARMGQAYAGRYRWSGAEWTVVQPPGLWDPEDLDAAWAAAPAAASCGSALALFDDLLQRACPAAGRIAVGDDRAAALLELALQARRAGAGLDAALALPLYLRDKVALTSDERSAARAAAATP